MFCSADDFLDDNKIISIFSYNSNDVFSDDVHIVFLGVRSYVFASDNSNLLSFRFLRLCDLMQIIRINIKKAFGLVAIEPTFIETVVNLNEDGLLIFLSWTISLSYENFQ